MSKSSLILILVIFTLFPSEVAFSKSMTLQFASFGPAKGYIGKSEQLFFDEIKKQTNGKLLIERSNSFFFKSDEIFDAVRSGRVQLAAINIANYPKRLILNSAIYLFQKGPVHYDNIMWIYDQIYEELPELNNEFRQFNQKTIYRFTNLPTGAFFTKPVNNINDFKGKRIRCSSRWAFEILKGLGAVPITVSRQNLELALKTNAIEGFMSSLSASSLRFKETIKCVYIARELWPPRPLQITINLDTWNRLPLEIQKGIEIAAINARKKMSENYSNNFELSLDEHKKIGHTIVFANQKDINTWTQQPEARQIFNQWKAETESAGYKNTDILLERIKIIIRDGIERDKI